MKQSYDVIVFNDPFTSKRVVIHAAIPSREQVQEFVATLRSAIQTHRQPSPALTASLPDQISQLAKLKGDGILTEEEFLKAKQNLIEAAKVPSPIGFAKQ